MSLEKEPPFLRTLFNAIVRKNVDAIKSILVNNRDKVEEYRGTIDIFFRKNNMIRESCQAAICGFQLPWLFYDACGRNDVATIEFMYTHGAEWWTQDLVIRNSFWSPFADRYTGRFVPGERVRFKKYDISFMIGVGRVDVAKYLLEIGEYTPEEVIDICCGWVRPDDPIECRINKLEVAYDMYMKLTGERQRFQRNELVRTFGLSMIQEKDNIFNSRLVGIASRRYAPPNTDPSGDFAKKLYEMLNGSQ